MIRALLWKEWRTQRAIVAVGFGLALVVPLLLSAWVLAAGGGRGLWVAADMAPFVTAVIVWPLLAAIAGAATGSDELAQGTLGFLLSRPVSRRRLWLTKSLMGALAVVAVLAFSFGVSALFNVVAGNEALRFPFSSGPFGGSAFFPDSLLRVYVTGAVVLAYAAAVYFAAFVSRPIASAALGLAAGITVCGMIAGGQHVLAHQPGDVSDAGPFAVTSLALATAIVLGGGMVLYRIGNAGGSEPMGRRAAAIGAAALLLIACSTALVGAVTTRVDPRRSVVYVLDSLPNADAAVVSVRADTFAGPQFFVLDAGGSYRRLTPRMSVHGELSPDGRSFAYITGTGAGGLRGAGCRLRLVGIDGREDRELARFPLIRSRADGCETWGMGLNGMKFSPDASRLALVVDGSLLVVDARGGNAPRRIAVPGVTFDGPPPASAAEFQARSALEVLGWTSDGVRILLQGSSYVVAVDAESGAAERLIDVPDGDSLSLTTHRGALIPFMQRRPVGRTSDGWDIGAHRLLLLGTDSGGVTEIVSWQREARLWAWAGKETVLYLVIPADAARDEEQSLRRRELHRFTPATGTDELIAESPAFANPHFAPREDVVAVEHWGTSTRGEMEPSHVAVFGRGAPLRFDLPPGWQVEGWLGADHLVVSRHVQGRTRRDDSAFELAIADLEGNLVTVTYREY